MSRSPAERDKPITWMGDSLRRITEFPADVKKELGFGLRQAQMGSSHTNAKPLHGDLSEVMEMVCNDRSGTYRAVYTVKLAGVVYVLHCFQKKSKKGIATPELDLKRIRSRLKEAKEEHGKPSMSVRGRSYGTN